MTQSAPRSTPARPVRALDAAAIHGGETAAENLARARREIEALRDPREAPRAFPSPWARAARRSEIATASGYLDLRQPEPAQIGGVAEIAVALSRLCRFGGRLPRFYSVAEHSILCDQIAADRGLPAAYRRAVLFHDAAEAYVGDVARPLKALLPVFDGIEARVLAAIFDRFGIVRGFNAEDYDLAAFAVEKREFFPGASNWGEPSPGPWQPPRFPTPDAAALEFVRRAEALGIR